jgi:ribosomal protein S18 acetylase RimI-like enzyme
MRAATNADAAAIRQVAIASFTDYFGHYHADPRLDNALCDAVYIDWAERSLSDTTLAQFQYVAEMDNEVVGFVTARMVSDIDGEVVLSGVLPEARRQGIYQSFLEHGTHWCQEQGAQQVWFITQIINVAVQTVYVRLNYRLHHSEYTLHKWFDD